MKGAREEEEEREAWAFQMHLALGGGQGGARPPGPTCHQVGKSIEGKKADTMAFEVERDQRWFRPGLRFYQYPSSGWR
jgi:hypothetical protein